MRFVGLPPRNLARRPARSILTATGIAMAVAAFVALTGLSRGMERSFVRLFLGRDTHILAVRRQTVEIMTSTLEEALGDRLRSVEGVSAVAGELYDLVELQTGDSVLTAGWPDGSFLWSTIDLREGRVPLPLEDGIVVGEAVAEALGAKVGHRVPIGNHDLVITGISRRSGVMSGKLVVVRLGVLQALLGRPGKVSVFNLRVERPEDPGAVAATRSRLQAAFPKLRFTLAGEVGREDGPLRFLRSIVQATSAVALLIGVVLILNTLLMSVTERRREIGVLTAVGWDGGRIVAMIVGEGIVLASLGGLLGVLVGIGALHGLAETPQLHGFLEPEVGPAALLQTALAAVLLGMAGSLYPAWRAARLKAVDALRAR